MMQKLILKQTVFRRTFAYIALLLIIAVLFFETALIQTRLRSAQATAELSNTIALQRTSALFDMVFYSVRNSIDEVKTNATIINTVIVPDKKNSTRNFDTLEIINSFCNSNRYIERIVLHNHFDGSIYTSNLKLLDEESFDDFHLLQDKSTSVLPDTDIELLLDENKLYLRFPFLQGYKGDLSTLLITLDTPAILNDFIGNDADFAVLLGTVPVYMGEKIDISDPSNCSYYSDVSGLTFLRTQLLSHSNLHEALSSSHILFQVGMTISLIILALFVTWLLYRPLHKLLTSREVSSELDLGSKDDEWTLLNTAIKKKEHKNLQYKSFLSGSSYDICQQLFTELLDGADFSDDYIDLLLEGIESNFTLGGRYIVYTILPESDEPPEKLVPLFLSMVGAPPRGGELFTMPYHRVILSILRITEETEQIDDIVSDCKRLLLSTMQKLCPCSIGESTVFYALTDLPHFFRQSYNQCTASIDNNPVDQDILGSFFSQIMHVVETIPDKTPEQSYSSISGLLSQVDEMNISDYDKQRIRLFFLRSIFSLRQQYTPEEIPDEYTLAEISKSNAGTISRIELVLAEIYACLEKRQNKYLVETVAYLNQHFQDSSLSLSSVADIIGVNSSYLSKLFGDAYYKGFNQYLNDLRIQKAKELLRTSDMKIRDIGPSVGFLTVQTFIRVFKKSVGVTPNEYKRTQN